MASDAEAQLHDPSLSSDELLPRLAYQALALVKLKQPKQALALLQRLSLGSACEAALAPNPSAFALLLLQARLTESSSQVDELCALLDCAAGAASSPDATAAQHARSRASRVLATRVELHAGRREEREALYWLEWGLARGLLPSRAAYEAAHALLLQSGDVHAAADVERSAGGVTPSQKAALALASCDAQAARQAWTAARWENNASVAALYCGDLAGAVSGLESALSADAKAASETLVANLCSLCVL